MNYDNQSEKTKAAIREEIYEVLEASTGFPQNRVDFTFKDGTVKVYEVDNNSYYKAMELVRQYGMRTTDNNAK